MSLKTGKCQTTLVIVNPLVLSQDPGPTIATEDVSIETISSHPQELLDIVQESITGVGGATTPTAIDEHTPES